MSGFEGHWCFFVILLFLIQTLEIDEISARGGRGGGRGGGRRSRGSGRSTGSKGAKSGFKGKITTRNVAKSAIIGLATKRIYSGRSGLPIHFIYFRSSELDNRFVVNGNEYDTPFILVDDKNQPFRCITVPKGTNEQNCPKEFEEAVIFNKTYFQLPDEFEERKTIRTASQIDLCCGSAAFYPSFALTLVFVALNVLAAH